jgi:S-adenosylmethionine decarboxylase
MEMKKQPCYLSDLVSIPVGMHCILELYGCPANLLDDIEFISEALEKAAEKANAHLVKKIAHHFEPQGVTALALLSESHISIHTWPENGYIAIDAFTCGGHTDPERACRYFIEAFHANNHLLMTLPRGKFLPTVQSTFDLLEKRSKPLATSAS